MKNEDKKKLLQNKIAVGEIPRYVYHYCPLTEKIMRDEKEGSDIKCKNKCRIQLKETTLNSLLNNTMYLCSPAIFNDPYDCIASFDKQELEDFCHRNDFEYDSDPSYLNSVSKMVFEKLHQNIGIACFSRKPDNTLLWAHYATNHEGICLKFDILEDPDFFWDLKPVVYCSEIPKLDINRFIAEKLDISPLFINKSIEWAYEEELRLIKNETGNLPYNISALKEIIFGCKSDLMFREQMYWQVVESGQSHKKIKFSIAIQNFSKYELSIIPFNKGHYNVKSFLGI
jgi:hypothetical protein